MIATSLLCLVVGISDGDTLTARCGEPEQYEQVKVRLQGIDAPERKQPFGDRSRQALAELTFQKEAELRCIKTDRYKRQVSSVGVAPASAPTGPAPSAWRDLHQTFLAAPSSANRTLNQGGSKSPAARRAGAALLKLSKVAPTQSLSLTYLFSASASEFRTGATVSDSVALR
ncbi:micrococcal nuclease-like protein [Comamonas thiooxydans]|nr:micrococcal nuclease-like protein [Comamonas thiooxydans]